MPLRIQINRMLTARSQRVKSVDIHPREPFLLAALYDGNVYIWNYNTQQTVKSFEVVDLPVRCARFIAREGWVVTGSDDMMMRCYNYNTMEKLKQWDAHSDYIRSIVVHPVQPYVLSSSDDMTIKLWDWSKKWQNTMVFEGHTHYVMQIAINPKDTNTFASASLDRTVKVWGFNSPTAHFTLEGHEKGVNCVEYSLAGDKPYIVSGADDKTIKIWDYQNKTCVQTLEGHRHNVAMVCFHPVLPVIVSGSEDGTVKMWNANTYRLEKTLNYGMERVWCAAYLKGSNVLALGYDEGTVMIKLGGDSPAMSMDNAGKVVWAQHNDIQMLNVRAATNDDVVDGETMSVGAKELGNTEIFPQSLKHDPKGRFVVVCGDGEFVIYTALAWRNKAFGSALEFVWADGTGDYCVRESSSKIKLFKNFKERHVLRPDYSAEHIFGGALLAVSSSSAITFYDWAQTRPVRKIEVVPKEVYWSDNGEQVALVCDKTVYVLQYNAELVKAVLDSGAVPDAEGIDDAFEVLHEIGESVASGLWVGDCFVFTNKQHRLNYYVGGEVFNIAHLEKQKFLLGYLAKEGRVYLADKDMNVVSYKLETAIINYQTAILRGDIQAARKFLPDVPQDQRNRVAQFLESQGLRDEALAVSTDPDQRFDLAVALQQLGTAHEIAKSVDSEQKWRQLSDLALRQQEFELALSCLQHCDDVAGLLLLYTCLGNTEQVRALAESASKSGKHNVAFICRFLLRDIEGCIKLLIDDNRVPEAAFFARTYAPSLTPTIVAKWKTELSERNPKAAEALADPIEFPNLFPDFDWALAAEKELASSAARQTVSYAQYATVADALDRDLIKEAKEAGLQPIALAKPSDNDNNDDDEDDDVAQNDGDDEAAAADAQAKADAEAEAQAAADAQAKAEAEAQAKADEQAKAEADAQAQAEAQAAAEAQAKAEAEAQTAAEAQAKAEAEAEAKAAEEAEAQAKAEAEAQAEAEAAAQAEIEAAAAAEAEAESTPEPKQPSISSPPTDSLIDLDDAQPASGDIGFGDDDVGEDGDDWGQWNTDEADSKKD